jgi:transcriptional regulator
MISATGEAVCVLDIADQGELTLEEIGKLTGVTRERVRQIEEKALRKLARRDRYGFFTSLRTLLDDK